MVIGTIIILCIFNDRLRTYLNPVDAASRLGGAVIGITISLLLGSQFGGYWGRIIVGALLGASLGVGQKTVVSISVGIISGSILGSFGSALNGILNSKFPDKLLLGGNFLPGFSGAVLGLIIGVILSCFNKKRAQ